MVELTVFVENLKELLIDCSLYSHEHSGKFRDDILVVKVFEKILFCGSNSVLFTRYNSTIPKLGKSNLDKSTDSTNEASKAWPTILDIEAECNNFSFHSAHPVVIGFGIRDFIVARPSESFQLSPAIYRQVLSSIYMAVGSCSFTIPIFLTRSANSFEYLEGVCEFNMNRITLQSEFSIPRDLFLNKHWQEIKSLPKTSISATLALRYVHTSSNNMWPSKILRSNGSKYIGLPFGADHCQMSFELNSLWPEVPELVAVDLRNLYQCKPNQAPKKFICMQSQENTGEMTRLFLNYTNYKALEGATQRFDSYEDMDQCFLTPIQEKDHLCEVKPASKESLPSKFAIYLAQKSAAGSNLNKIWHLFLNKIEDFLTNSDTIPNVDFGFDRNSSVLNRKLQTLNACIRIKRNEAAYVQQGNGADDELNDDDDCDEEFFDTISEQDSLQSSQNSDCINEIMAIWHRSNPISYTQQKPVFNANKEILDIFQYLRSRTDTQIISLTMPFLIYGAICRIEQIKQDVNNIIPGDYLRLLWELSSTAFMQAAKNELTDDSYYRSLEELLETLKKLENYFITANALELLFGDNEFYRSSLMADESSIEVTDEMDSKFLHRLRLPHITNSENAKFLELTWRKRIQKYENFEHTGPNYMRAFVKPAGVDVHRVFYENTCFY